MHPDSWWISLVKLVGIPGAVAAYFMLRDWYWMADSIKLQTEIVSLLRQLVQNSRFGQ